MDRVLLTRELGDFNVSQTLFVMGSFSPGNVHHKKIADFTRAERPATVVGSVYLLQVGYPVFAAQGQVLVRGSLLDLADSALVRPILDQFFGFNPQKPEKSPFVRIRLNVLCEGQEVESETYALNAIQIPKTAKLIEDGDWQQHLAQQEPLTRGLTEAQRTYIKRLGASTGREIVPINLQLYRELMNKGLVVDKGRRLSLTSLGKEVYRFLEE